MYTESDRYRVQSLQEIRADVSRNIGVMESGQSDGHGVIGVSGVFCFISCGRIVPFCIRYPASNLALQSSG